MPLGVEQSRRKRNLIVISAFLALLLGASAFNLTFKPAELPIASNLVVIALANLNVLVLSLLLMLLFRNLIKLWFERRQQVIGARFKAKLVLAFLALAVGPAALIFVIASNFITRSIEGWFKPQVERPLDQALAVAQTYYQNLESLSLRHARQLARTIARDDLLAEDQRDALAAWVVEHQEQLALNAVTVFGREGQEIVHAKDGILRDAVPREPNDARIRRALGGAEATAVRDEAQGDLIEALVPVWSTTGERQVVGAVLVATHIPERLESKVRLVSEAFKEYKQLKLLKNPIKFLYILLFLLMTLIVVFSFTWFGLYLARGITDPVAQLAEGTREVAAGNLGYKVQARADDELGALVHSFNQMTDDLSESKRRLEEAYLDLQDKHTELEERRRYIETVMEAVTTGVVSFDPLGRVTTINKSAARMFNLDEAASVGRLVEEVFGAPDVRDIVALVHRTRRPRGGVAELEIHPRRNGVAASLLASATALRGPEGEYAGAVVVFDDLTELLKAQRVAAWREVAQRIAHEIKNPLTPIQLSAQRLRRRLARTTTGDDGRLVVECTETIIQEVDALKRLVDEFSRFARMPAPVARPTDVRAIVDAVASFYREVHPQVAIATRHGADVPVLEVDPDHLKRAILNLVDNAVEAVNGAGDVAVETRWLADTERVQIAVSDTGSGITPEHREKLFQPYFSTKAAGMGLGLPIVHEIVAEHGGTIRVEDNDPRGSRFIIELPCTPRPAAVGA